MRMGLFVSKINIVKKNRNILYYNKYKYSATIVVNGARYLMKYPDINKFEYYCISKERRWRHKYNKKDFEKDYDIELIQLLQDFLIPIRDKKEGIIRTEESTISLYTNSVDILEQFNSITPGIEFVEVIPAPPKTMYFSETPEYGYRVYMKSKRLTVGDYDIIENTIKKKTDSGTIKISDSLKDHLHRRHIVRHGNVWGPSWYPVMSSTYFINYNDESTLTYLQLVFPDCLGKVFKLEKRPEKV